MVVRDDFCEPLAECSRGCEMDGIEASQGPAVEHGGVIEQDIIETQE